MILEQNTIVSYMGLRFGSPGADALLAIVLALCIIHGRMADRQEYGRVAIS